MIKWATTLSGSWEVVPGLSGTVPASGLAYASVGDGVAAVGVGLTVYGYSSKTGALEWQETLTGFPAGAAIVSVRTWPGEVTAGVSSGPRAARRSARTEVVISDQAGAPTGRYPAAPFGGAVAGSPEYTVIVGATAVTSYDNATGHVRWQRPTGRSRRRGAPTATGSTWPNQPAGSWTRRRSPRCAGSTWRRGPSSWSSRWRACSSTARSAPPSMAWCCSPRRPGDRYSGTTGAALWSIHGAVPESTDHRPRRIYLTEGSNLVGVDPQTGRVKATASGSAVNGSAGVYVVRSGVALGLDQGGNGDAWGYDLAVQRVTLAAAGLPWPHYFVDLSGVGGSADPASDLVIIAACTQLAPIRDPAEHVRPVRVRPPSASPSAPSGSASPGRCRVASPGPRLCSPSPAIRVASASSVVRVFRIFGVGGHAEPQRQPLGLSRGWPRAACTPSWSRSTCST